MQNLLFIVNDSPYGGEKTFNALRFAIQLLKVSHLVLLAIAS